MDLRIRTAHIVFAAILGTIPTISRAANYTWTGQSGNWSDPANWAGGNVPQSTSTDQITFTGGVYTSTLTADHNPWIVNGITLNSGELTFASAGSSIQFDGTSPFITQLGCDSMITAPIILGQTTTYSMPNDPGPFNPDNFAVTVSGSISGAGGLVMQDGELMLTGANSFSGGVTMIGSSTLGLGTVNGQPYIDGTTLDVQNPQALGTGPLTLQGNGAFSTVTFFSDTSAAFNNDVIVQGQTNRILSASFTLSSPSNITIGLGHLTFSAGDGSLLVGESISHNFGAQNFSFTGMTLAGNATIAGDVNGLLDVSTGGIDESGGSHSLHVGILITLIINGPSTYSGGTVISGTLPNLTTVIANSGGALGTGAVSMDDGVVTLNAPSAANNTITGASLNTAVNYNANGAAGGHLVTTGTLMLGSGVNSLSAGGAGDSFATLPGGLVVGNGAALGLLDRSLNFNPGAGTVIQNMGGGLPTSQHLGTAADLLIGLASSYNGDLALGIGTPWFGMVGNTGPQQIVWTGNITASRT